MFIRKIICAMTIVFGALMCSGARATQYYVSPDGNDLNTGLSWAQAFATIEEGIDTASNDDVIDVNEGTYTERVDFDGKAITLSSTDPNDWDVVEATIIDPAGSGDSVLFISSEDFNSVLTGFTTNGLVSCYGSGPTIKKCIIAEGIDLSNSSPTIENNKISSPSGYGIIVSDSAGTIRNNWIYDCSTDGIFFAGASAVVDVNNNTIVDNSSAGIRVVSGTAPNVTNCILWGNDDDLYGCTATYSCIEDCTDATGTGNICGDGNDPLFAGWMNDPFYLAYNSPCIDKGDPDGTYTGQTDIEGDNRVVDGRIDMGADEFIEFLPPFGCENEPNVAKCVNFGGDDPNNEDWTNYGSTMSEPYTDPNDGTITYRELLAGKRLYIYFPAFNLDDGYDPNDPNDPNSLPLTDMLLEIMYRDTIYVDQLLKFSRDQVFVISKIDYINLDPNYPTSDRIYGLTNLGGSEDGSWKYSQYGFKKSDFQLIRAIDGCFTIEIRNSTDINLPIDYVSLRKITPEQYYALFDKQRQARCFYEVELPADAPASPNYDDPNMVIFSRDIMRPVYQHTKPGENEPNSISAFGVWGQIEPLSFSIYSQGGTNELAISVSDLQHTDGNTISGGDITISRVIYDEKRFNYTNTRSYALVPERLEELEEPETFSVDANTSQRLWLKIDVPDNSDDNLPSGLYEGTVTIDPAGGDPNTTIDIDFTVYDINLLLPEHINTVYSDPFTIVYSSDLDEVFKAYRETGFDPFMSTYTHCILVSGDANNLVFDSNNFEAALDRMVEEGHAVDKVCRYIREWGAVYNAVMPSSYNAADPNLYYKLSDSNFVAGFEELLGVYENIADSYNPPLEFIYHADDEPGNKPDRRILCDRLYTIIKECNEPNANNLQTGVTYYTVCDEPLDPNIYNVPDGNIPPLTDLVDYKFWSHSWMGTGYANHQDPNYHGYFSYYTTGESQYPNPVYNRFLHGLFPFVTDAWGVAAYTMWNRESDPYNDFDTEYRFRFPFTYPSFIFAYPTWSGKLHSRIGGLEGIREGIKDAAYIATLKDLIDDDPEAPVAIEAQDYLDEIKSRISTNYNTAYLNKRTDPGYYQEIVEDVSEDSDPDDFEAFSEIRQNIVDFIVLLDSGINYKVYNSSQNTWYTTISAAINDVDANATLVVYPNVTYSGTVDFNGVSCTLTGKYPNDWDVVEATVITTSGVSFTSGEDADSVLTGCTVDAGIDCEGSSPVIKKCIITEGIDCSKGSSTTIENNRISNSAGHGVVISKSAGQIKNNWIYDCTSNGIFFSNATAVVDVNNNTIVDNTSDGIKVVGGGTAPNITNCILWGNNDDLQNCTATYSCIEDGDTGTGNICGDANNPLFVGWLPTDGLISYWKLDDGSGTIAADSVGDNDGNVVDATWTTGKLDGALDFDGSGDYVSLPSIAALEGNSVTIAAWIYADDFGTSSTFNPILTQYNASDDGYYLYTYGNKPAFYIAYDSGSIEAVSPDAINTGQWYHIVGINNGSKLKIYVNGDLKNEVSSAGYTGVEHTAYIGYDDKYNSCFDGIIDDVVIYNEASSAFEIEQLFLRGLNGHNDYHLSWYSPCINAGDPNKSGNGESDIDNQTRVKGGYVDMGADEAPSVHNTTQNLRYFDIQLAIDGADANDEIVVSPGMYTEPGPAYQIDFDGKAITIISEDPNNWDVVEATVITSVVLFFSGEDTDSKLLGCTVDNAIVCDGSSPIIKNCIIKEGIELSSSSSPTIENNKISNPSGFGIIVSGSAGVIRNNWIYDSTNGIFFADASAVVDVNNNTIVDNSSAGIRVVSGTAPNVTNCILWYNDANDLAGCTATYSCIEDCNEASGTGNICGDANDPLFDDPNNYDYHIDVNSPCIDAGDPDGTYTGQMDIDFEDRVDGNDVDMGGDEYHS